MKEDFVCICIVPVCFNVACTAALFLITGLPVYAHQGSYEHVISEFIRYVNKDELTAPHLILHWASFRVFFRWVLFKDEVYAKSFYGISYKLL